MNSILVPTDFSETAKNAGLYAVSLAEDFGIQKIILYNAYQAPVTADPSMPAVQLFDIDILKKIARKGFNLLEPIYNLLVPNQCCLKLNQNFNC